MYACILNDGECDENNYLEQKNVTSKPDVLANSHYNSVLLWSRVNIEAMAETSGLLNPVTFPGISLHLSDVDNLLIANNFLFSSITLCLGYSCLK